MIIVAVLVIVVVLGTVSFFFKIVMMLGDIAPRRSFTVIYIGELL